MRKQWIPGPDLKGLGTRLFFASHRSVADDASAPSYHLIFNNLAITDSQSANGTEVVDARTFLFYPEVTAIGPASLEDGQQFVHS